MFCWIWFQQAPSLGSFLFRDQLGKGSWLGDPDVTVDIGCRRWRFITGSAAADAQQQRLLLSRVIERRRGTRPAPHQPRAFRHGDHGHAHARRGWWLATPQGNQVWRGAPASAGPHDQLCLHWWRNRWSRATWRLCLVQQPCRNWNFSVHDSTGIVTTWCQSLGCSTNPYPLRSEFWWLVIFVHLPTIPRLNQVPTRR